jgi:hypothetical protein
MKKIYENIYNLIPCKNISTDDSIYLLNDAEIKNIKRKEIIAIFLSSLIGVLMVLILYLPQYFWPFLFPDNNFILPFFKKPFTFSVIGFIYGMVLVFAEIILLSILNIYCAHEIAFATGFINSDNKNELDKKNIVLTIASEKINKDIIKLGIDPYAGLNKKTIILFNLFFTLKAALSSMVLKLVVQRVLGRYALRKVIDMLGIPVFAFWNAWGTRKVLRQTRVIIMGQNYLIHFKVELNKFRELTEIEKSIVYDTLQFISESKRDYHQNHFMLSKLIIEHFQIKIEKTHNMNGKYFLNINDSAEDFKLLNEKIILLGFVLDGEISVREKKRLKLLIDAKVTNKSMQDVLLLRHVFLNGKGYY